MEAQQSEDEIPKIDPLWTTDRVADYFGVEPSTILRWITRETGDDQLKGRKINNRWRVPQSEVFRYRDYKYAQGESQ